MEQTVNTIAPTPQENAQDSACGCNSGGCGCHSHESETGHSHHDLPVRYQILRPGDRVVDLGSGLGQNALTVAGILGQTGKVLGIDISEKNVLAARKNADSLKINNIEFRHGDVVKIDLPNEFADVVYADCMINLQKEKQKIADEMYRICDHNGLFSVTDFVYFQDIPDGLRHEAAQLAGCIAGSENLDDFVNYFSKTGFQNIEVVEINKVMLPDEMYEKYLSPDEVEAYKDINSEAGIFRVNIIGEKPSSCSPETCCCNPDKHKE